MDYKAQHHEPYSSEIINVAIKYKIHLSIYHLLLDLPLYRIHTNHLK